jgi:hypothetical protein
MKWATAAQELKSPLNHFGAKYFSQSDEDRITLKIIRRLVLERGTFLKFGPGDVLENNTPSYCRSHGAGLGSAAQDLALDPHINPKWLSAQKARVALDNIAVLTKGALADIAGSDVDVLTVDLDGNDSRKHYSVGSVAL